MGTRSFALLLASGVLLRVALAFLLPSGAAVGPLRLEGLNDEPSHVNYAAFLADSARLPVQVHDVDDAGAFERNDYEFYQPPLYYALCAVLSRAAGGTPLLVTGRLVSLLCGLATLWLVWLAAGVAGLSPATQRVATACAVLFPVHAYFCSVVSNDAMSWLAAAAAVWLSLRLSHETQSDRALWRCTVLTGFVLGVGMLTKSSALVLYPMVATAYALVWLRRRQPHIVTACAVAITLSLAIAAPWYLRNLRVYGTLLAFNAACGDPRAPLESIGALTAFLKYSVRSFWFPMQHVPGSRAAGLLGWCGALLLALCAIGATFGIRRGALEPRSAVLFGVLLAAAAAAYVRFNLVWPHAEGRFLLPALGPLTIAMALAIERLRARLPSMVTPLAATCVLCCWPWLYLLVSSPVPLSP